MNLCKRPLAVICARIDDQYLSLPSRAAAVRETPPTTAQYLLPPASPTQPQARDASWHLRCTARANSRLALALRSREASPPALRPAAALTLPSRRLLLQPTTASAGATAVDGRSVMLRLPIAGCLLEVPGA